MPDGRDGRVVLIVQEELVIRMEVVEAFETGGSKSFKPIRLRRPSTFFNASQRSG
jgi:hypothetical protein